MRIRLMNLERELAFEADLSQLRDYDLPGESLVFVEAYRQTSWMRFPFGRVGAITPPVNRVLTQFDSPEGVRFRVKVIPASDSHKLLAEADSIPLYLPEQTDAEKETLLPVKPAELDGEVFRLDFSGGSPILLINRNAGAYSDIGRSPTFVALVYPSIFRQILTILLLIERHYDDTSDDDWRSRWLRFATSLPGSVELPSEGASDENVSEWIDDTVAAFARSVGVLTRFGEFWKEGT